jgi:hypothetical protein
VRALKKGALVAFFAACSIYDSSLLVEGGADVVAIDGGPDVFDPCDHAEPPARPAQDDPSDAGGDVELTVAVRTIDFSTSNEAGAYGYDLDHTCTCPAPETCVPAKNTQKEHCDDSQGRDNAGGALIQNFAQLTSAFDTSKINANLGKGSNSVLFRVSNWNGAPNDTSVSLAVFVSNGTVPLDDAGANPTPKHDGNDQWGLDPSSLVGTPPPIVPVNVDDSAYVAGGVLVAHVSFPFGLGPQFGATFLRLDGAFLVAPLVSTNTGWAFAGVVTGRWDTRNILTGMQGVHDPFDTTQFLCGTDPTYQAFKAAICQASDIASVASNDNTNAPCNALSLAVGFTTEPAKLGGELEAGARQYPCGQTYSDQCGN